MNEIQELRDAKIEVEKNKKAILSEMRDRGAKGQLWSNGKCAAWSDYEAALERLDNLRNKFGV